MRDTSLNSTEEVRGLVRAGRAAIRTGDYDAARVAFTQALVYNTDNIEAKDGLADAQRRLGLIAIEQQAAVEEEFCYRHPDVETGLHCVQCNRPICARCSFPGAVGQLCPECRKGRRSVNYQVDWLTLVKAGAAAVVAALIGSFVIGFIPLIFLFFLGFAIGEGVLRVVDWATHNKRGRAIQMVVALGLAVGVGMFYLYQHGHVNLINTLIFLVISIGTAVARLR